jgi:hypothetical protein
LNSLARSIYLESRPGVPTLLHPAGTALENPYVYDSVARELKELATRGLVRIDAEESLEDSEEPLIARFAFTRLR